MLEYWNAGKMGKRKMNHRVNRITTGNIAIKWIPSFLNPNFHYSMTGASTADGTHGPTAGILMVFCI
jgi:hypothetical protein